MEFRGLEYAWVDMADQTKDEQGFELDPSIQYYDTKSGAPVSYAEAKSGKRSLDPSVQYYDPRTGNPISSQEASYRAFGENSSAGKPDSSKQDSRSAQQSSTQKNGAGAAGGSPSPSASATSPESVDLPSFDRKKTYLVKGESLNEMVAAIQASRVRVATGGGLKIVAETADGIFLAIDGIECP